MLPTRTTDYLTKTLVPDMETSFESLVKRAEETPNSTNCHCCHKYSLLPQYSKVKHYCWVLLHTSGIGHGRSELKPTYAYILMYFLSVVSSGGFKVSSFTLIKAFDSFLIER